MISILRWLITTQSLTLLCEVLSFSYCNVGCLLAQVFFFVFREVCVHLVLPTYLENNIQNLEI